MAPRPPWGQFSPPAGSGRHNTLDRLSAPAFAGGYQIQCDQQPTSVHLTEQRKCPSDTIRLSGPRSANNATTPAARWREESAHSAAVARRPRGQCSTPARSDRRYLHCQSHSATIPPARMAHEASVAASYAMFIESPVPYCVTYCVALWLLQ